MDVLVAIVDVHQAQWGRRALLQQQQQAHGGGASASAAPAQLTFTAFVDQLIVFVNAFMVRDTRSERARRGREAPRALQQCAAADLDSTLVLSLLDPEQGESALRHRDGLLTRRLHLAAENGARPAGGVEGPDGHQRGRAAGGTDLRSQVDLAPGCWICCSERCRLSCRPRPRIGCDLVHPRHRFDRRRRRADPAAARIRHALVQFTVRGFGGGIEDGGRALDGIVLSVEGPAGETGDLAWLLCSQPTVPSILVGRSESRAQSSLSASQQCQAALARAHLLALSGPEQLVRQHDEWHLLHAEAVDPGRRLRPRRAGFALPPASVASDEGRLRTSADAESTCAAAVPHGQRHATSRCVLPISVAVGGALIVCSCFSSSVHVPVRSDLASALDPPDSASGRLPRDVLLPPAGGEPRRRLSGLPRHLLQEHAGVLRLSDEIRGSGHGSASSRTTEHASHRAGEVKQPQ